MTKQKFYEQCILYTFKDAFSDESSPIHDIAARMDMDFDDVSFDEFLIKLASIGHGDLVPEKEVFSTRGWPYVAQVLCYVDQEKDPVLTHAFFSMLKSNRSLIDLRVKEQDDLVYNLIYSNLIGSYDSAEIAKNLIDFYLLSKHHGQYLKPITLWAETICLTSIDYEKLHEIKSTLNDWETVFKS